ncbi:DUF3892 domain-containing protein [Undibacterium sp. TC9W]|uniref:DUF3892 domain-containing protein n=1 Tax=Undibacterium sp. TC9W TaxID=3413053 RepID=UPI003BF3A67E
MDLKITHVRIETFGGGLLRSGSELERVTHVANPDGGWIYTKEDAINRINLGIDTFYTHPDGLLAGGRTDVEVVNPQGRAAYLRTNPNNEKADNLLSLPRC